MKYQCGHETSPGEVVLKFCPICEQGDGYKLHPELSRDEPVRPLEALIAKWRDEAVKWQRGIGDNQNTRLLNDCADELTALLQAAAPPAPTAEPNVDEAKKRIIQDLLPVGKLPQVYPSDIADRLDLDYDLVVEALLSLQKDGLAAPIPPERVSEGKE